MAGFWLWQYRIEVRNERARRAEEARLKKVDEYKLTFIEGWTLQDYGVYLEKQGVVDQKDFAKALTTYNTKAYQFLTSIPKGFGLEGFLFPDTYRIAKPASTDELLSKMLENFYRRVLQVGVNPETENFIIPSYENIELQSGKKGVTLYQAVTLASIVEKETGRDLSTGTDDQKNRLLAERKTIAGIFYNRLQQGKPLESDATINFITGKNVPAAAASDLKINSPYNTYLYPGLPAGPICNPSASSLEAVFNPIKTEYLYFLHRQPSGDVVYSKTFDEHIANKRRFLR